MVENTWEICNPLEEVYGTTASERIKQTLTTATEDTQCALLHFFKRMTPSEDRSLVELCIQITFWCYCESIKKISPIIAETTNNLMY